MSKIDEMVNRFLAWKLPQDFSPDAGITFVPPTENAGEHFWPTGTNLLTATQVKVMLEHVVGERIAELESELMEQARLLGISGEREAGLLARIVELKARAISEHTHPIYIDQPQEVKNEQAMEL